MLRIDGTTPLQSRMDRIKQFNATPRSIDVILVSTRAGGEGINLTAGTRIVMVSLNPIISKQYKRLENTDWLNS